MASNVAVSLSAVKSITEMANLCSGQFPQVCTFYINNLAGLGSPMPIDGSIGIKWTPRPGRSSWHFQVGNPYNQKYHLALLKESRLSYWAKGDVFHKKGHFGLVGLPLIQSGFTVDDKKKRLLKSALTILFRIFTLTIKKFKGCLCIASTF